MPQPSHTRISFSATLAAIANTSKMNHSNILHLQQKREHYYQQLKKIYASSQINEQWDKVNFLNRKIEEISVGIAHLMDHSGRYYDREAGVYRDNPKDKEAQSEQKSSSREQIAGRKGQYGDGTASEQQEDSFLSERDVQEFEPIDKKQWYNTAQVKRLTGRHVVVGGVDEVISHRISSESLESFLARPMQGDRGAFSYLKVPDDADPSRNHFVSFYQGTIAKGNNSVKNGIIYYDSNGQLMDKEDRAIIARNLSDAVVFYVGKEGQLISEKDAQEYPALLLRTQFNHYDCGMHTSEMVAALDRAQGNSKKLSLEIQDLQQRVVDSQKIREQHSSLLAQGKPAISLNQKGIVERAGYFLEKKESVSEEKKESFVDKLSSRSYRTGIAVQ